MSQKDSRNVPNSSPRGRKKAQVGRISTTLTPVDDHGVLVVLEQKTTILWKCLYLLASLKDSSGLGGTYETKRRSEEENPVHRQNTTVNVDKIRGFRPPYMWVKTFVFVLTIDRASTDRCFLYACYGNPEIVHTEDGGCGKRRGRLPAQPPQQGVAAHGQVPRVAEA